MKAPTDLFDAEFRLVGDEDCGVGIDCQVCDRGGAPVAYYTWPGNHVYENTDVKVVHTISALFAAARGHMLDHRRATLDGKAQPRVTRADGP